MVHQLSLFDSVDDESYDLLISTLNILSGNPPVLYSNLSQGWKPNEAYDIDRVNSKNQLVQLNRIILSKELPLKLFAASESSAAFSHTLLKKLANMELPIEPNLINTFLNESMSSGASDSEEGVSSNSGISNTSWALKMYDIPAAGSSRKVSTQTISESVVLSTAGESSSLATILRELGYIESYQYITAGVKFLMKNDLTITVQKIWDVERKRQITSGGFLVKAFVNVARGTDIERIDQAENTLLAFQKEMQGYIDLTIPDRKAMDSRMDYVSDNL